jgi:hypothetical protein
VTGNVLVLFDGDLPSATRAAGRGGIPRGRPDRPRRSRLAHA